MRNRNALLTLALTAAASVPAAAQPAPLTARDMQSMQRISDPRPSPAGDRVAYVVRSTDFAANRGRNDIWLVGIDGKGGAAVTSHEASDTEPRWAPDGRSLYFLSTRSGSSQVWRVPVPGSDKDAVQVTDLPLDVANLTVSPDGSRLAFTLEVFPDCPTIACTRQRLDEKKQGSGMLFEEALVRHWDTWKDGRRNHLFVQAVTGGKASGEPVDVTKGMKADTPSRPFGGSEEYAFSPDGRTLVFTARDVGREEAWSTDLDLFEVPVDGSAKPKNLTDANQATDTQPAFSPDGKTLAYLAMRRPQYESDRLWIRLRDMATGRERVLAEDWDRSPSTLEFSRDGKTLYVTASDIGQVPLFAIDVASGKVRKLVSEGHVRTPALAGDGFVLGLDTFHSPVELHTVRLDGSGLTKITDHNRERLAKLRFADFEQFKFEGAGGDTVYGWLTKPAGFQAGKKYPLAFVIHGGPHGASNNDFHYRWNPQVFAGAGYAVVQIDFHASAGYGQTFADAIRQDWGGKPLVDLQKGLEYVGRQYPWIDTGRACALGASYGGYMVNWIAGQWTDAFRCLVNHDGIFDQRSMYYSTEELWFPEYEMGGPYWENEEEYEKHNPANHVDKWKTPMLVVHGGLDYRIPEAQALATFNALQRRNIPSQFLFFPDENHWVLKPANSIQWYDTVLAWLGRWTR